MMWAYAEVRHVHCFDSEFFYICYSWRFTLYSILKFFILEEELSSLEFQYVESTLIYGTWCLSKEETKVALDIVIVLF